MKTAAKRTNKKPASKPTPEVAAESKAMIGTLKERLMKLPYEARKELFNDFSKPVQKKLLFEQELWLSPKQTPPPGDWKLCICRAGRSFGKSYVGCVWLKGIVMSEPGTACMMVGPSYTETYKRLIKPFLQMFEEYPKNLDWYNENKQIITLPNGSFIDINSADTEIRGGSYRAILCDEVCKWQSSQAEKAHELYKIIVPSMRGHQGSQMFISSTPKYWKWLIDMSEKAKNPELTKVVEMRGRPEDNPFLTQEDIDFMRQELGSGAMSLQELEGEYVNSDTDSLFSFDNIDQHRITPLKTPNAFDEYGRLRMEMQYYLIGVDPAIKTKKKSDLTGISVVGMGVDGHAYVFADASGKMAMDVWAREVVRLRNVYGAYQIIAEDNQGGEMIRTIIHAIDPYCPIGEVTARNSKFERAGLVAPQYNKGMVHHVGVFNELESELVSLTPRNTESPDRADALIHVLCKMFDRRSSVYISYELIPHM